MAFHVPRRAGNHPRIVLAALAAVAVIGGGLIAWTYLGDTPAVAESEADGLPLPTRPPLIEVEALPRLEAALDANPRFMGGVLVAKGDQVLFRQVYGMADREAGRQMQLDSRFRLASVSKQFTAAAILRLQDRGVLDIRDPLCKWITECPEAWRPIRLHHLLTHTAGVPDLMQQSSWGLIRQTPRTPEELTATTAEYRLSFEPGTAIRYSNAGYNLLGVVVERASGMSFEDFLETQFFEPLGMADTGSDADAAGHDVIMGYGDFPQGLTPQPNANVSVVFASGALYSTLDDMLVWQQALHRGHLLSDYSHAQMVMDHAPIDETGERVGRSRALGYGLYADRLGERTDAPFSDMQVYHTGSWSGFRNLVLYQPDQDVTVVVLSNNYHLRDMVMLIAQQAMAEALGRDFPRALTRG
ncbi:serine hydrolase domain-containing protein [Brevundimonas lutea]|uniref:serine hydrolase domain-containing protein n=1 Tax=Brevundimonas lutea TaxID=2293980 RepID=UPI0013CE822C|nr:serine hydrolase domain-containing protein [Brevundimonas lutea]